jgi:dTDP-4-dehydrorhamnose reductase
MLNLERDLDKSELRWVILGGNGELGTSIARKLQEKNFQTLTLSRTDFDVTKSKQHEIKITEFGPDVIINAAAWTNVELAEVNQESAMQVNGYAVAELAKIAKNSNSKFFQLSTNYVFAGDLAKEYSINAKSNPVNQYGISKDFGEKLAIQEYSSNSYIIRTSSLYGPNGTNFVNKLLQRYYRDNEVIEVVSDQFCQPTFAGDLADQIIDISLHDLVAGIYHCTNSGVTNWFEFSRVILESLNLNAQRVKPVFTIDVFNKAKRPLFPIIEETSWGELGLKPMRNWEIALKSVIQQIHSQVLEIRRIS